MLMPCTRLQASFADPGVRVELGDSSTMVWDEHGGTFVLKVSDLKVAEVASPVGESFCRLEISLRGADLIRGLEEFAALHQLPLAPPSAPDLAEGALLAACHLPGKNLFVFAEAPTLTAVRRSHTVELAISGVFKARRVPCQETDLVIHLAKPAMTRLVAYVLHQARTGL
ncbi:MAG: hypothetical protein ACOZFS_07610 [Thermodesulfobacteriota bacterium]